MVINLRRTSKHHQRGEGDSAALGVLALILVAYGIFWLIEQPGEREGFVNISDCRETVTLTPDTFQKYFKPFTCTNRETRSGKIMGGQCVHIEYDSSLFSSSNVCKTAYVYEEPPDALCADPKYPYLGYDDKCYTIPQ